MRPEEYVPIRKHQADLLKVAARVETSQVVLLNAKVNDWSDVIHDRLVHQIEGFVLANCPREISWHVSYPSTWWEAFKRDVLATLTSNALTPVVKRWHDFLTSPKLAVERFSETVYANICPHGTIQPSYHHLEWMATDRELFQP